VLLGLALLELLSLEELWADNVQPVIRSRFTFETYLAIELHERDAT
jgi:hypothetical protein